MEIREIADKTGARVKGRNLFRLGGSRHPPHARDLFYEVFVRTHGLIFGGPEGIRTYSWMLPRGGFQLLW